MADPTDGIDSALAAFREGEEWQVAPVAADVLGDLDWLTGLRLDAGQLAVLPEDDASILTGCALTSLTGWVSGSSSTTPSTSRWPDQDE